MNRILTTSFLFLAAITVDRALAADTTGTQNPASGWQQETLLGGKSCKVAHGGFGALETKATRIDGHSRFFSGGKGAWVINHDFYVGMAGYGMTYGIEKGVDTSGKTQYMQMGYGGLLLGYTFQSEKALHWGVENLIGAGGYVFTADQWEDDRHEDCDEDCHDRGNAFFVWEPSLFGEVNLARYVHLTVGGGYRLALRNETKDGLSNLDLGGPTLSAALKIGKF